MELDRIKRGDRAAFHELVRDVWAPLVRYCRGIVPSDDAAQDAAQEALVRLWERRESWSGGSARAVLFRVARNAALDERRKDAVRSRAGASSPRGSSGGPPTPEDELRASGLRERVVEALEALPERRRETFELVRRQGFSYREVSEVMGVSVQTVANQMNPIPEMESDRRRIAGDRARAHGVELLLAREGTGRLSWSAAYALAWSEILLDGTWRPRTLDQRHTVNLAWAWRIDTSWQLSGSWQYHTGWPFTDQVLDLVVAQGPEGPESVEVVRRGFGELNADRLTPYHRLDLRLTRAFTFERSRFELFLDVFNAYDRTNLRGWQWSLRSNGDRSYRAVKDTGEEQLPIMPTIGFRWVF